MKISYLEVFRNVVESGGMTQAANLIGVSQPGISRIIREMENQLGTQLFRRTGRGVELTPAGEVFSESNLTVKRPGLGISPMRWDEVIGRKAKKDFATDESITL